MKKNIWKNLEIKIGLMLLFVAASASIGIYRINYTHFYSLTMADLKQDAINLHGYAEKAIDVRIFTEINTIEDQESELYINTHRQLDEIRRIANAKFLYTIKLNDNNEYIYLVDGLEKDDENFSYAGMLVEDEYIADLNRNMEDVIVSSDGIMVTDYGYLYSMSFPFHDHEGNVIGVIGIDFDTEQLYHSMNYVMRMTIIFTLILGAFFTVAALIYIKGVVKHTEKVFNRMTVELERHDEMMSAVNKIASLLLTVDSNDDTKILFIKSLEIVGQVTNADRIHIWQNEMVDGVLHYSCIHSWISKAEEKNAKTFQSFKAAYNDKHLWKQKVMRGEYINSLLLEMPPDDREYFQIHGASLKAVTIIPLFLDNQFWGMFSIDHCKREFKFSEEEIEILRSVGLMIITEINRNVMKEAAEHSSRAKSIFLSQMSHEIRTPMNAILGIAEIRLRNYDLCEDVKNGLIKIYESGSLLLNIINDILDFSQIDAGKLEIVQEKYSVPNLLNDVMQMNRLRYESKPIELKLSVDEKTPIELIGDGLRIKQILNNLLSNAYKYTDTGEICFSIAIEKEENNNETVRLVVKISDTGQGMNEIQLNSLYDPYTRFNLDRNSGIAGTGLGMNITKRLVDAMNGKINVESCVGKGTVFTVSLPQKISGLQVCGCNIVKKLQVFSFYNELTSKIAEISYEQISDGRVLIVDDVNINLLIAQEMLKPYGLHIETAENGLEAVEKIKNGTRYDIVFMDHMMPVMDGLKATKLIREWEAGQVQCASFAAGETRSNDKNSRMRIPIVALTANAVLGQEEMFLANGFDAFIAKPIDSHILNQVVTRFIKNVKHLDDSQLVNKKIDFYKLEKIFISDAENAINVLGKLSKEIRNLKGKDLESYIIAVHGVKSALNGIGEKALADLAYKLELAGKNGNYDLMANFTPVLIEALSNLIKKFEARETEEIGDASCDTSRDVSHDISQEDMVFLNEKLDEIKTACQKYNVKAAKKALADLKLKPWPRRITDICEEISVDLLCGEFKKVLIIIEKYNAEKKESRNENDFRS